MRDTFYKDLSDELLKITDTVGEGEEAVEVPVIKHIDLWNEQFKDDYKGIAIQFPAVFIKYLPIQWKQMGGKLQVADVSFQLFVCTSTFAQSHYKADDDTKAKALSHYTLINRIFKRLAYFAGDYFGTCLRTASDTDHYHHEVMVTTETYVTHASDGSALPDEDDAEDVVLILQHEPEPDPEPGG